MISVTEPSDPRQIGPRLEVSQPLESRKADIENAIAQGAAIAQDALARIPAHGEWSASSLEFSFGVTLTAETGIIVSKLSGEASFEVKVTLERKH